MTFTQVVWKIFTGVGVKTIVLFENFLSSKLQNIYCISQHEEFNTLCLNIDPLTVKIASWVIRQVVIFCGQTFVKGSIKF